MRRKKIDIYGEFFQYEKKNYTKTTKKNNREN